MAYMLDGLAILIVALCVFIGFKKGFVRSVVMLVGIVLTVFLAGRLCVPIATVVYDNALEPHLQSVLEQRLEEEATEDLLEFTPTELFESDSVIARYLDSLGLNKTMTINLTDAVSEESIRAVMTDVVRPAFLPVISFIAGFLLFVVLLLVVWLLSRLIDKLFKLPVLKQLNTTGGIIVGALQGLLWAAVFATVIALGVNSGLLSDVITRETMESTYLVSRLSLLQLIF